MSTPTASARDRWPVADGYLLNHSAGLPPRDSAQALAAHLFGPWVADNDQVWPHWMQSFDRFRACLAQVLKHESAMVCPQPSVSAALSQILDALPRQPGRTRLLIAERAFPSLGFVFALAQRHGFELVMIPRQENTLDPAVWEHYLDERVHMALLTHVHSNTSECHDIAALCRPISACGAVSVVDVAQSIGIRPVDARAWDADFIVGSCIKWLCGGPGAGFLWVNPRRIADCAPTQVGWFSHADPFEFDIRHFEYAPDALRFWGGTPSVAPALVAAHSMQALLDVGLEAIEACNRALTSRLVEGLEPAQVVTPRDPEQRGGSVVLNFAVKQSAVIAALREAGIQCDARDEGLRLSPHFYNSEQDIDRVLTAIDDAL